ncbi:MAG: sensor histidine kinase [Lachnospiraceae bacterium]|nr:sensor histidine kinase [Lachnospiraceae bacterium]
MSFLFIAIPIIAGVLVIALVIVQTSSRRIILQSQATELERVAAQFESIFNDTENVSREIIYNSEVQQFMEEAADENVYPEDAEISYYINGLILNRDYIGSVVLTSPDRTLFSTENAFTDLSAYQNITEKWWYPQLTASTAPSLWFAYSRLSAAMYESQQNNEIPNQINTPMLARTIYSTEDYQSILGYLMIYLDDEYIAQMWQDLAWGQTTNIYLFDENGDLLLFSSLLPDYSNIFGSVEAKDTDQVFRYDRNLYALSSTDLNLNNWTLYMLTPYNEINGSARIMMWILLAIIAAIVLALFILSRYSASSISKPIVRLSNMMDSYHGAEPDEPSLEPELYEKRPDEIGRMYRSYEQLEDRMNRLIQDIYVKNLEKKDAELALLQSQINPHFLYNTLDSINWMALANDQEEISSMITALSDTFRLSLMKSSSHFIEMKQEVDYIQSYLVLQKFRYADRLSYEFDLPEIPPELYILRFILQPVVENALKHGIDKLPGGGKILIRIRVGAQVTIYVINDGANINLKKMNRLLVYDPMESDILNFKKEGYGVQNIYRRIKIICGDEYGLSYYTEGEQTVCRIILPVKESLE